MRYPPRAGISLAACELLDESGSVHRTNHTTQVHWSWESIRVDRLGA